MMNIKVISGVVYYGGKNYAVGEIIEKVDKKTAQEFIDLKVAEKAIVEEVKAEDPPAE